MRRKTSTWLASVALALVAAGCGNFLTGPGVDKTPNAALALDDAGPLYISLQAGSAVIFEGPIARTAAMYDQQVSGINRQQQGFDFYNIGTGDIDPAWIQVYSAGGASDARRVQDIARKQNDSLYIGVAKVWEAMIIGEAASVFGDIPYSQAFQPDQFPTPQFDPQLTVYDEVQQQLDSAINVFLAAKPATGVASTNQGPTGFLPRGSRRSFELGYPGSSPTALRDRYLAVAHTLKARFYLHTAEVPERSAAAYANALTEAQLGIDDPSGDLLIYHDANNGGSNNVWNQFYNTRFDQGPGSAIVNLMKKRVEAGVDTPDRFDFYFYESASGDPCRPLVVGDPTCEGYRPGANIALPEGSGTLDFNFVGSDAGFRQPIVTFAETQLIAAEAAFQEGGQAAAQPFLDAVRDNQNYGEETFPAQTHIPATLQNIMEEKYIDLFLNIESFNDYKRTCFPYLVPAPANTSTDVTRAEIPGRLPYGLSEVNTNPNTPKISGNGRNANDPVPCQTLTYSSVPRGY
jgi:hypothetical protein